MSPAATTAAGDAARGRRLLGAAGLLLLLAMLGAPYGGLLGTPLLFFLKNRLNLSAHQVAMFNLVTSIPLYGAVLFGLVRDRWSPFGLGDRGHLLIFGSLASAGYLVAAFAPPTYGALVLAVVVITVLIQTVIGAATGLLSTVGQRHLMPGQASAVLNIAGMIPLLTGFLLGGALSGVLERQTMAQAARGLFLLGAGLMAAVAVAGQLAPRALYAERRTSDDANILAELSRLARTWAVYPPLILLTLWNFAPSFGTALAYHMANTLHATDAQVGQFYAIYWGVYIPCFLAYTWLCRRVRLRPLLFWSVLLAVPQMLPLLLVRTPEGALWAAAALSLMGGLATGALFDLAIRSCPAGLEGAMMLLVTGSAYYIALRLGDLWGTEIYDHAGGFTATVIASTVVYALMLPVLWLVPKRLTATRDGEAL